MSGAGSAEDVVKQIQDVQGRDISLEEKNRLINSILSHSSRYRSIFFEQAVQSLDMINENSRVKCRCNINISSKKCNYVCSKWMEYEWLTYQVLVVCNGVSSGAGCGVLAAPVLTYRPPGHHMRKLVTGGAPGGWWWWWWQQSTLYTNTGHGWYDTHLIVTTLLTLTRKLLLLMWQLYTRIMQKQ